MSNTVEVRYFFKKNNGGTEKFYQMVLVTVGLTSLLITRYGKKAQTENGGTVTHNIVHGDLVSEYEKKKREKTKGGYVLDVEVSGDVIVMPSQSHINFNSPSQHSECDRLFKMVEQLLTTPTANALFDELGIFPHEDDDKEPPPPPILLSERDANWGAW